MRHAPGAASWHLSKLSSIFRTNAVVSRFFAYSVHCRPTIDRVEPTMDSDDDDDDEGGGSSVVRYLHVAEVPDEYSVGVFVFGPNACIPLHNHPGMCVLSRILYGSIRRTSLDLAREDGGTGDGDDGHDMDGGSPPSRLATALSRGASWLQRSLSRGDATDRSPNYPEGTQLAFRRPVDVLEAPAVTILYPYEGNLHEFAAGPHGAAVLDVLLPPYDERRGRDCTYYDIRDLPAEIAPEKREDHCRRPDGRVRCLIVPRDCPESFRCVSGQHNHLGDGNVIDYDLYDGEE